LDWYCHLVGDRASFKEWVENAHLDANIMASCCLISCINTLFCVPINLY
jgi:hypothetical protein